MKIRDWLLAQQYRQTHSYTNAAPGGWAWTDLPGGVPDADDTAGALLALRILGEPDERTCEAASLGIQWLLDLQNRDGGIPTFCRGWGTLPFDRSAPDLTAHAIRAWLAWIDDLPAHVRQQTHRALEEALSFLVQDQQADGSWVPLWFGNQFAPAKENRTYGTARVLRALVEIAKQTPSVSTNSIKAANEMLRKATAWLLSAQHQDGSWGESRGQSSVEETALAVEALAGVLASAGGEEPTIAWPITLTFDEIRSAVVSGSTWLICRVESGEWKEPSPIGFYFAKLWYYERLYPLIFTVGALAKVTMTTVV